MGKSKEDLMEASNNEVQVWTPTITVNNYFEIDDQNKKWAVLKQKIFGGKGAPLCIYNYTDLLSYELIEDDASVTKGGLGMAALGALTFGGAGAIVGSVVGGKKSKKFVNSLKIKITVKDMGTPPIYINFLTTKTKCDSFIYKTIFESAQKVLAALERIKDQVDSQNNTPTVTEDKNNIADEIRKFKELLDEGIISEEEFAAKKQQLLNL
ncbi:SHOCT domain-containing protein [Aminipila sp.]|uniref:SHOCT domain-containing protein n=1 Tax=Aminipila sp. TaxID=2060095 RepID=UPI00289EF4D9|nr:SHOCT domain-containing protein [Aminipila sp.]